MLEKNVYFLFLFINFLINYKTINGLVSQKVNEIPINSYAIADLNYSKIFTFLDLIQQRQVGNKVEQVNF